VTISASRVGEKLRIQIVDNGVGFRAAQDRSEKAQTRTQGSRTALKNCQERLNLHYGNSSDFKISDRDGGGCLIELLLPLGPLGVQC